MSFALWHIGATRRSYCCNFTMGYLTGKNEAVQNKGRKG